MSRKRPRRPGLNLANPMENVMRRVALLSEAEQAESKQTARDAFARLATGEADIAAWKDLADMLNLSEALAELRVGSNLVADIEHGQAALRELMMRANAGRGWAVSSQEIERLNECLVIFCAQLGLCSGGEYLDAFQLVQRRVSQAIAKAIRGDSTGPCVIHERPHLVAEMGGL